MNSVAQTSSRYLSFARKLAEKRAGVTTSAANALEMAALLLLSVGGIAIAVRHLGSADVGLWLTVSSLTGLLGVIDLGVGNAAIGKIAAAKSPEETRDSVALSLDSAVVVAAMAAVAALVCAGGATLFADTLRRQAHCDPVKLSATLLAFAPSFALNQYSAVIRKIFLGLNRAYVTYALGSISATIALLCLIAVREAHLSATMLIFFSVGVPSIGPTMAASLLFRKYSIPVRMPRIAPEEYRSLARAGSAFFIIQVGATMIAAIEPILISVTLGAASVTTYVMCSKPFQYVSIPFRLLIGPLWPRYSRAAALRDDAALRRMFGTSLIVSGSVGAVAIVLVSFAHSHLVYLWSGGRVHVSRELTIALAVATFFDLISIPVSTYMNGCAILQPQVVATCLTGLVYVPTKVLMLKARGVAGAPITNAAFSAVAVLIIYAVIYRAQLSAPLARSSSRPPTLIEPNSVVVAPR